jgi:nucleoid DNA-binding protein
MSLDYNSKEIEERRNIKLRGFGTFEFSKYRAKKITDLKQLKDDRQRNICKEIT